MEVRASEPALVVEAYANKNPVTFWCDPVTIQGTLEVVPKDAENSTFYRLFGADG